MVKVTFVKIGYIATTTLVDVLLDERSGRKDLQMRVVSSSVSMEEDASVDVAQIAAGLPSDLYVIVSPNAAMPGPTKAREALHATGKPIIIISDEPSRKVLKENPVEGVGYIIVTNDPMIGAKQAFLDPVEMALFNADAIRDTRNHWFLQGHPKGNRQGHRANREGREANAPPDSNRERKRPRSCPNHKPLRSGQSHRSLRSGASRCRSKY